MKVKLDWLFFPEKYEGARSQFTLYLLYFFFHEGMFFNGKTLVHVVTGQKQIQEYFMIQLEE